MNIQHILEGWKNDRDADNLPEPIKELFDSRLKICRSNECGRLLIGICTACGCPVKKKTKVLEEECPENMWEPIKYEIDGKEFIRWDDIARLEIASFYNGPTFYLFEDDEGHSEIGIYWEDWQKFLSLLNYELTKSTK